MTDKDPKDMTASELLRKATMRETDEWGNITPHVKLYSALSGEDAAATDYVERGDLLRQLADKIDAELAQARNESLLQGAQVWAKANGWPDFSEGEDFGAWLDRCALQRPRFEDGEPVQFEDDTDGLHGVEKFIFTLSCGGSCQMQDADGNMLTVFTGGFVKRPAPEALGADGLPIVVGETVWGILSGIEGTVSSMNDDSTAYVKWDDGRWSPCIDCCNLTHTPPDTQERIDEDKGKKGTEYWRCVGFLCGDCPAEIDGKRPSDRYGVLNCSIAQGMDIARRQADLDARKGGE